MRTGKPLNLPSHGWAEPRTPLGLRRFIIKNSKKKIPINHWTRNYDAGPSGQILKNKLCINSTRSTIIKNGRPETMDQRKRREFF